MGEGERGREREEGEGKNGENGLLHFRYNRVNNLPSLSTPIEPNTLQLLLDESTACIWTTNCTNARSALLSAAGV